MEIKIALMLAGLAVTAFICAPFALQHSVNEGRPIQGFLLQWSFNLVGVATCIALAGLIIKTVLGEM